MENTITQLESILASQQSFGGKAIVSETPDGTKHLVSYDTHVATIKDGEAVVHNTQSTTTIRHIKDFLYQNDFGVLTTKQVKELQV